MRPESKYSDPDRLTKFTQSRLPPLAEQPSMTRYTVAELRTNNEGLSSMAKVAAELSLKYELAEHSFVDIEEVDAAVEEKCWEQAYKDFESNTVRLGLRAKLFAELGGDGLRIKIQFLRLQAAKLIQDRVNASVATIHAQFSAEQTRIAKERAAAEEQLAVELARQAEAEAEAEGDKTPSVPSKNAFSGLAGLEDFFNARRDSEIIVGRLQQNGYELIRQSVSQESQLWTFHFIANGRTYDIQGFDELKRFGF